MGRVSATEAALTGFRFVSHNLRTVGIWAAAYLAIGFAFAIALVGGAGPTMTRLAETPTASESPEESLAMLQQIAPVLAAIMLFTFVFYSVLFAAINRAVLRPDDDRHAYLRFGRDELRQCLLFLLSGLVGLGVYIGGIIAVVVVALAVRFTLGETAMAIVTTIAVFAMLAGLVFVWVRLSLAPSLTFDRGRVDLFGSWRLTKGRFWTIFGTYLLVWLLGLLIVLLTMVIVVALVAVSGGLEGIRDFMKPDFTSLGSYLTPARVVVNIVSTCVAVVLWPVLLMPMADLYAQITELDASAD